MEKKELTAEGEELYALLKQLAGKGKFVQVPQVELASMLGIGQCTVSKRLRELKRKDYVQVMIQMDRGRPNLMLLN